MEPVKNSIEGNADGTFTTGLIPGSSPFSRLPDELIRTNATHLYPPDGFRRASWAGDPAYSLDYFCKRGQADLPDCLVSTLAGRSCLRSGRLLRQSGLTPCLCWEAGCNATHSRPLGPATSYSTIPLRIPRQVPCGIRQMCLEHNHIGGAANPHRRQPHCVRKLAELDNVRYSAARRSGTWVARRRLPNPGGTCSQAQEPVHRPVLVRLDCSWRD